MTGAEKPTPLFVHTLETLCKELLSGRAVQLDDEGRVFRLSMSRFVISLSLLLFFSAVAISAAAGATVSGETNRPSVNTFVKGEAVTLSFTVAGIVRPDTLSVRIKDENGLVVASHSLEMSKPGEVSVPAPGGRFGFFRVETKLSADGAILPAIGTRGEGYLTYAVVPDPQARPLLTDVETRFGLQGSSELVFPYLGGAGCSAAMVGAISSPKAPGQYAGTPDRSPTVSYQGKPWTTYDLPTLYVRPPSWARGHSKYGPVSSAHEQDWCGTLRKLPRPTPRAIRTAPATSTRSPGSPTATGTTGMAMMPAWSGSRTGL